MRTTLLLVLFLLGLGFAFNIVNVYPPYQGYRYCEMKMFLINYQGT